MSVKIIVDSTADLTPEVAQQVKTVPLTIHFGEKQYVSGVDIDSKKFYEMLVESDVLPTTSQPTPYAFSQVFQEVVDAGDTAVCLTVSSKLSGTYQSASIAAEEFPGRIFLGRRGSCQPGGRRLECGRKGPQCGGHRHL